VNSTTSDIIEASADATGRPWSSSAPDVTDSRNIAVRPEVGIVVFDSRAPIGTGQGVYMSATARLLDSDETVRGIEAFSRRSVAHGGRAPGCGSTKPPPAADRTTVSPLTR
jgi:hypothetical protein